MNVFRRLIIVIYVIVNKFSHRSFLRLLSMKMNHFGFYCGAKDYRADLGSLEIYGHQRRISRGSFHILRTPNLSGLRHTSSFTCSLVFCALMFELYAVMFAQNMIPTAS